MDILTLSIGVGLVVGLIFVSFFGLSAGGMVVPGYIALEMNHPGNVIVTFISALLIYAIVRFLSNFLIIYGRRRIALTVLLAFILGVIINDALATNELVSRFGEAYKVIGYIIPGLIALSIDRQGIIETLGSLLIASVLVRLLLIILMGSAISVV
ncbi:poly-gamma-glutamate biosynthesis protein PgsC [Thiotrichales bacterium 19X7-9]|nr:poly-gamma-glutamate biosynthesis protein PgsC [Thiotrichales bacterium 19X7-9]